MIRRLLLGVAGLALAGGVYGWLLVRPASLAEVVLAVLEWSGEDLPEGEVNAATRRAIMGQLAAADIRDAVYIPFDRRCSDWRAWAPHFAGMPRVALAATERDEWAARLQQATRLVYRIDPIETRTVTGLELGGVKNPPQAEQWAREYERQADAADEQGQCGELQLLIRGGQRARLVLSRLGDDAGLLRHTANRNWVILRLNGAAQALQRLGAQARPVVPEVLYPELTPPAAMARAHGELDGGQYLDVSLRLLSESGLLRSLVGAVISVRPALGPHRSSGWQGESFELTLVVQGDKGQAVARLSAHRRGRADAWNLWESYWHQGRLHDASHQVK